MLLEWHVICVEVKYVVSCLGRLVSFNWWKYECEYEISLLRMLKPLSLVCMNDIRPWIMLRGSFMWNHEPSGKVRYVEVKTRNGSLQVKEC